MSRSRAIGRFLWPTAAALVCVAAAGLRLWQLGVRPIHADEAVQAIKFGQLLQVGYYRYDPHEFHGPTLNYFTLPVAWVGGARRIGQLTETHLRLLPAVIGTLLVLLVLSAAGHLGRQGAFWAAVFTAFSPALVFYSRYYIHETLLVLFSFAAIVALWGIVNPDDAHGKQPPAGSPENRSAAGSANQPPLPLRNRVASAASRVRGHGGTCSVVSASALPEQSPPRQILPVPNPFPDREKGAMSMPFSPTDGKSHAPVPPSSAKGAGEPQPPGSCESSTRNGGSVLWPFPGKRTVLRLVLLGLCLGFAHATKETWIFPLAAMAAATVVVWGVPSLRSWPGVVVGLLLVAAAGLAVSAAFFSSLFSHPRGILDSFSTYLHYFRQAGGADAAAAHTAPWHEYLRRLFWWPTSTGYVSAEAAVGLLALVGAVAAWLPNAPGRWSHPARFLSIYTMLLLLGYSALPYKTPWCASGAVHGLCLLAGFGAQALWRCSKPAAAKALVGTALLLAAGYSARMATWFSLSAFDDARCPFAYAQTTGDATALAQRLHEVAGDGGQVPIQVICPNHDYWPLPWYLRDLEQVGWFDEPPSGRPAPVLVVHTAAEQAVVDWLYRRQPPGRRYLYVPLPRSQMGNGQAPQAGQDLGWQLRPGVWFRVYLRLELWQRFNDG